MRLVYGLYAGSKVSDWFRACNLLLKLKRKSRANAFLTFNYKVRAHLQKQVLGNGKPQACTLNRTDAPFLQPVKRVEKLGNVLLLYANTGVLNGNKKLYGLLTAALKVQGKVHAALVGILNRVCKKVQNALPDSYIVTVELAGNHWVNVNNKFKPAFLCTGSNHIDKVVKS